VEEGEKGGRKKFPSREFQKETKPHTRLPKIHTLLVYFFLSNNNQNGYQKGCACNSMAYLMQLLKFGRANEALSIMV